MRYQHNNTIVSTANINIEQKKIQEKKNKHSLTCLFIDRMFKIIFKAFLKLFLRVSLFV